MEFHVHTKNTAPKFSQAVLQAAEKRFGFIPNLYGVLAESPAALQAYAAINDALKQSALSAIEQQVVALTVSAHNGCSYCVGVHSALAQMAKMPESTLAELRERQTLSDSKLNALRAFVLSVIDNRGWVPDKDLEAFMCAGYGRRHVLDVLTIIALKTLSNYVNHIANTPLDERFSSQKWVDKAHKAA